MLLDSGFPKISWADVLETVVDITNNTPTSITLHNSSRWPSVNSVPTASLYPIPFSSLVDAPPQVAHFRSLGSSVYVHSHGACKADDKLSPRAKEYKLIGYQSSRVFRLWDTKKDVVITSSDVIFPFVSSGTTLPSYADKDSLSPGVSTPTSDYDNNPTLHSDQHSSALTSPNSVLLRPVKPFAHLSLSPSPSTTSKSFKQAVSVPNSKR